MTIKLFLSLANAIAEAEKLGAGHTVFKDMGQPQYGMGPTHEVCAPVSKRGWVNDKGGIPVGMITGKIIAQGGLCGKAQKRKIIFQTKER